MSCSSASSISVTVLLFATTKMIPESMKRIKHNVMLSVPLSM